MEIQPNERNDRTELVSNPRPTSVIYTVKISVCVTLYPASFGCLEDAALWTVTQQAMESHSGNNWPHRDVSVGGRN